MFSHKHYVPILKSKEGEFKALYELKTSTKKAITPLFEIIDIPWNYEEEEESKTIEVHLNKIAEKVSVNWGQSYIYFVDGLLIDENRKMSDAVTHYFDYFFNLLRHSNSNGIPVTGLNRHIDYKNAIRKIASIDKRGLCIRLEISDLSNVNLNSDIDKELQFYKVSPQETDLIIDLDVIQQMPLNILSLTIQNFINTLTYINDWRTLTLSSSSFPIDLSSISGNTIDVIDRHDWELWNVILGLKVKRLPSYSDYGIAHPETIEIDPRFLVMSASIRYTCPKYWLILRGRSVKKYSFSQYYVLCHALTGRPEYSGNQFSWGDQYIENVANRTDGPGNATTWRKVANNHHFEMVIHQLSNLNVP